MREPSVATLEALTAPELRFVLDAMPSRIAVLDRKRRYRFVNRQYAAAVGLEPDEIVGRSAATVMGPARARRMAPLARAALEGRTTQIQDWSRYPLAGWDYVDTLYAPLCGPDGAVGGYIVLVRDLTKLKRREDELAHRTAQLEAILANVADGVTIADGNERLLMCNDWFAAMFAIPAELARPGVHRTEFVRHRLANGILYPGEDPAETPEQLVARRTAGVRAMGGVLTEQIEVRGRTLQVRRQDLPDGTSVSTFTDVTARAEAEQAKQRQREAVRDAQQLGTTATLLAGIGHELRNPLSVVATHATMLEEEAAGSPLEARAAAIRTAALQCGRIVSSLLSTVQNRPPARQMVRVADAVASGLDLVLPKLSGTNIAVTTSVPADLPPLPADPDQLVHLLANLLGNAIEALRDVPEPLVAIAAKVEGGTMILTLADNGPGIPPELRHRVFSPFFTTKPAGTGTGIGLALCRTIAAAHGGSIAVAGEPGGGASFVVSLPLVARP